MLTPEASQDTFESGDMLLVRRNPWVLAFAMSPVCVAIACVAAGSTISRQLWAAPALLSAMLTFLAYRENPRPRCVSVSVRANPEGVTLGDHLIPRAQLRAGFVSSGVAPRIVLHRRFRPSIDLQAESIDEARAFLRALGFDALQMATAFYGLSWVLSRALYTVSAVIAFLLVGFVCSKAGVYGEAVGRVVWVLWIAVFVVPTKIHIGAEGISIRWLWVRRTFLYSDIEDVTEYDETHMIRWREIGIRIALRSGAIYLPMKLRDRFSWLGGDPKRTTDLALTSIGIHCVFRRDPGTRSDVTRAAIPTAPGQPFRHPGSRSDGTRARAAVAARRG